MIPVDFELARHLQDERKSETAANRLVRSLRGAEYSRIPQWLSFRAARELLARTHDSIGVAANRSHSPLQSGAPR
jgi:hypothetical protein